jgi:PAS domain S-box-containing protein
MMRGISELEKKLNKNRFFENPTKLTEAINRILLEAISCETEEALAKTCLSIAEELTESRFGFLGEINNEGNFDTIALSDPGYNACTLSESDIPVLTKNMKIRGLQFIPLESGEPIIINNPSEHPESKGTPPGHPVITSFIGIPLKHAGEIYGMFALANKENGYTEKDKDTLVTLSVSISEALMRKKGEIQLEVSEERFRGITERSYNVIIITDDQGIVTYVSPSVERVTGYKPGEITGKTFFERILPKDRGKAMTLFSKLKKGQHFENMEFSVLTKSGEMITIEINIYPIIKDGNFRGVQAVYHNITERKKMEERLKNRERELQIIFDSVPAMIWYKDKKNNILRVNKRAAEAMGRPVEEIEGKSSELLFPDEAQGYYENDLKVMETGEPRRNIEEPLQTASGEKLWVRTDKVPFIDDEGNISGLIVLSKDITEEKKLQEELIKNERLAAIGRLASVIGHELRNPLGVINNSTYYLNAKLRDIDDPKVARHLQIMEREVERSNKIISDLLDFSRGIKPPNKDLTQMEQVIKNAFERVEIPDNIQVVTRLEELPPLYMDSDMMLRVFINLISNAVDAILDGGKIKVSAKGENGKVIIKLVDTGVGIPEENMDKLFTPLFSTKAKGVGLGLHVTRELVQAHNGSIDVESTLGDGTVFTVILPMEEEK